MSQARKDVLNGWKEIAQYISRDIRTVERWEKKRGLPVRRIPGSGRGVVYARISELEEWLAGHTAETAEAPEVQPPTPAVVGEPGENFQVEVEAVEAPSAPVPEPASAIPHLPAPSTGHSPAAWMLVGASLVLAIACAALAMRYRMHAVLAQRAADAVSEVPREHQHSRVRGVDDLYLRGAFALEQRTPESLAQARTSLSTAIEKDPGFAPAYSAVAQTYCLLREYARMPDPEAWPQAEANAAKAVRLDPQLSDAHAVLGFVDFFWHTDAEAADREFQRAIKLDPKSVLAHHWYGSMLAHDGRFSEALQQLDTAQHLKPSSIPILTQRALAIGLSGHRDEADAMLQEMLTANRAVGDHDSSTAHIVLALLSYQQPADLHRALAEYERSGELRHDVRFVQRENRLMKVLDTQGPRAMWKTQIQMDREEHPGEVTYTTVQAEAQLGEQEQALRDLRLVMSKPHHGVVMLRTDTLLNPLREDPEFAVLMNAHGGSPSAMAALLGRTLSAQ